MKDRIRLIMEAQHMTQQTFANFIGINAASLSSIFNERTRPTLNIVEAIKSKIPNLNTDWLMFGHGQMFNDEKAAGDGQHSDDVTADGMSPSYTDGRMPDLFSGSGEAGVSHQQVRGYISGITHFGYSAPYKVLEEKFGFTVEATAAEIKHYLESLRK